MIEREFSVADTARLEVSVPSGRVEVRAGDASRVRVRVETRDPGFIVEQSGDTVVVSSDRRNSWAASRSAQVFIEAGAGIELDVSTASARVGCEVSVSRLTVKTASGDIDIEEANTVTAKTASGDLDIGVVGQDLRFSSASGDIRVRERVTGTVAISTASGDVHINEANGVVEAHTVSGDIYIGRFTGRQSDFKTMSGDINVGVPRGSRVDLDVKLLSGKLRLPEGKKGADPVERDVSIKGKSVSGDFTLERA